MGQGRRPIQDGFADDSGVKTIQEDRAFNADTKKKSTISNYDFMRALLYIIENGCKWRALPKEYGNWHTIYVRFNRWSKNGTIDKIFEELQNKNIIEIRTEIICLDSTSIKVHPDAAGAEKSNGEQSIGRSKGGSQQRFIWLPRLPDMH